MKVTPTLEQVLAYRGDATHATVSIELLIDTETPISLYEKLAGDEPFSFLLESAEGGETFGRYSFIGFDPARTFRFAGAKGVTTRAGAETACAFSDPLDVVRDLLADYRLEPHPELPRFVGGAVGYLGYDCIRYFEKVPIPSGGDGAVPEGYFLITERLVIVDHLKHRVYLVDHIALAGDRARAYSEAEERLARLRARLSAKTKTAAPFAIGDAPGASSIAPRASMTEADYCAAVEKAKEAIRAGEIFQVVLSQRFVVDEKLDPFDLYRALRALNPSPYMFHIALGDWAVVGASPEVLVRLDRGEVLLRPIAGTRPRGVTNEEDQRLEAELAADDKELAEHRMLLDLGRNDVGRIARIGSVEVARPLHVERYSHVMHLVSDIRAKIAHDMSAFDVLRACFPAGTVSGAPKIRAMEIIAALENGARGLYAGAVGYFDFAGNMDTCIAIRSMLVEKTRITIQAGAGIVHDSIPASEHQECLSKAKSALAAIALARARNVP